MLILTFVNVYGRGSKIKIHHPNKSMIEVTPESNKQHYNTQEDKLKEMILAPESTDLVMDLSPDSKPLVSISRKPVLGSYRYKNRRLSAKSK